MAVWVFIYAQGLAVRHDALVRLDVLALDHRLRRAVRPAPGAHHALGARALDHRRRSHQVVAHLFLPDDQERVVLRRGVTIILIERAVLKRGHCRGVDWC